MTGLVCTSMLLSACACLYGCLSAAVHRLRRALVVQGALLVFNLIPLSLLVSLLPGDGIPARPWTMVAAALMVASLAALTGQVVRMRRRLSRVSIRTSCDHLPSALCFAREDGQPCLRNLRMDELSHRITGEAMSNANLFWQALPKTQMVTLEDGRAWRFERTPMEVDGQKIWQIVGVDVTEAARLNRELEADNRRLDAMNRRLRQYGQNVQSLTRERETLRAKVRIHDELGRTLLQTRRFLSSGRGDPEPIRAAWRQNIRLLLGEEVGEAPVGSLDQLLSAARAIGVTIDRRGEFPAEGTQAGRLVEAALHECLTNLVRHAGGTRLEVIGAKKTGSWHICCRNDGKIPTGPIVEGGGLSSLRVRVEDAGGTMRVDHAPRFALKLTLPEETERCFP